MSETTTFRISILTVCMNRQIHLRQSAQHLSALSQHDEHLIVDWSSADPLQRSELPQILGFDCTALKGKDNGICVGLITLRRLDQLDRSC